MYVDTVRITIKCKYKVSPKMYNIAQAHGNSVKK